jgi:hypothetical protein
MGGRCRRSAPEPARPSSSAARCASTSRHGKGRRPPPLRLSCSRSRSRPRARMGTMRGRVQKLRAEVRTVDPFTAAAFSDEEIDENVRNCEGNHMCAAHPSMLCSRRYTRRPRALRRACYARTHLCGGDGRRPDRVGLTASSADGPPRGANEAGKQNKCENKQTNKQTSGPTPASREIAAGRRSLADAAPNIEVLESCLQDPKKQPYQAWPH